MKLRYYLRGLGIGIVVTALTMGIAAGEGRPLTDAEIRAAAYELGMVESSSLKLTDIQPTPTPAESGKTDSGSKDIDESGETQRGADDGAAGEETPELTPEPTPTSEGTTEPAPELTPTSEGTTEPAPEPTPTPEATPESTPAPEQSSSEESIGTVTITIQSGSGSRTVCNQLAEAGLIEDAGDFDQYLMDNGYSRRICVGTYEIEMGADWEKIAKIISRTK